MLNFFLCPLQDGDRKQLFNDSQIKRIRAVKAPRRELNGLSFKLRVHAFRQEP